MNLRRPALAALALLALAGCAGPEVEEPRAQLPHRTYSAAPGAPDLPSVAAQAAAPVSAAEVGPLGDRDAPFPDTTAEGLVAAGIAAGVLPAGATSGAASCGGYVGCRGAATAGGVTVFVFDSSGAGQEWRDTDAGAAVEEIGGRRYWAAVDYAALDSDARSAWRDVLREVTSG